MKTKLFADREQQLITCQWTSPTTHTRISLTPAEAWDLLTKLSVGLKTLTSNDLKAPDASAISATEQKADSVS